MTLRRSYKRKRTQRPLWQLPRVGLACLTALAVFASAGCVNDDPTDLGAEGSVGQCELENNRRANDYYKRAPGQHATTMTAAAALNIHTECSADSTYSWESPY
mgnify:FL=1